MVKVATRGSKIRRKRSGANNRATKKEEVVCPGGHHQVLPLKTKKKKKKKTAKNREGITGNCGTGGIMWGNVTAAKTTWKTGGYKGTEGRQKRNRRGGGKLFTQKKKKGELGANNRLRNPGGEDGFNSKT